MLKLLVWATALGTAALFATQAGALVLTLDDGEGHSVTIADGGAGDLHGAAGAVTFIGSVGTWVINVTTGISFPIAGFTDGSEAGSLLDLASIDVSAGTGTLTITLENGGFNSGSMANFLFDVGGQTTGTVSASAIVDDGSGPLTWAAFGPVDTHDFKQVINSGSVALAGDYSQTIEIVIDHVGPGITSFDALIQVPEPAAIGLFGIGLMALGITARRRRRR
jgi:hypothetical protein